MKPQKLIQKTMLTSIIVLNIFGFFPSISQAAVTVYEDGAQYTTKPLNFIFSTIDPSTSSEYIKQLQLVLLQYGYSAAKPTGILTADTKAGIESLQFENGLVPDGIAGIKTAGILNALAKRVGICGDGKQRFVVTSPKSQRTYTEQTRVAVRWLSCGFPADAQVTLHFTVPGVGVVPLTTRVGNRKASIILPKGSVAADSFQTLLHINISKK